MNQIAGYLLGGFRQTGYPYILKRMVVKFISEYLFALSGTDIPILILSVLLLWLEIFVFI